MTADSEVVKLAVSTIRALSADVVQKANSGHPGMPLGMAPAAYVLFTKFLHATSTDSKWVNRDRFVLSNGHGCALLYSMLHLLGYNITVDDLKEFRQWESKTPGHPEYRHTHGVDCTTGPLGQGISTAVGMAMAQVHQAAVYNRPEFELFNNFTYVFCGDGCLQEGVSSEACSFAGHQKLGRLIVIYDDNKITIDGDTSLSFTEDVPKRFESYGWHTITVTNGNSDLTAIETAIMEARSVTDRPSLISLKTTIGFTSKKAGTHGVHGSPLGAEDIAQLKLASGLDPAKFFFVPESVQRLFKEVAVENKILYEQWLKRFANYHTSYPQLHSQLTRVLSEQLPESWKNALFQKTSSGSVATRKMSNITLNAAAAIFPELIGGSADLSPSTLTELQCSHDFQPKSPEGRYIRFGVREHGMIAIGNGISLYGGLIPFTATFLNFITYGFPAVRMAAISRIRHILVMTHDSIGLGEDGPTHQPVEVLTLLRATPNVTLIRPADQNEVNGSYVVAIENSTGPTVLAFSRQNVPAVLENTSGEKVAMGAYVIKETGKNVDVVLVATGTEVCLAVQASDVLQKDYGVSSRVVSAPSLDLFDQQSVEYRKQVLPLGVPVISVEAQGPHGWADYAHYSIAVQAWGASAPAEVIYDKFGFTPAKVASSTKEFLAGVDSGKIPPIGALRCQY
uniref:Transketolase n=1 Tax=Spongospora subterranea TaxID=70186 RepID=A0A0H5RJN2_9EUKA|eukprot:CRZ08914.1 hypothetical protein [Spongospora subterranea]